MAATALKVTLVLLQIVVAVVEMVTEGVSREVTVTVTGFEGKEEHPNASVFVTVYVPLVFTIMLFVVAPLLQRLPEGQSEVNVTLLLEQNVSGPPAVMTGVTVGLTLIRKVTGSPVQVFMPVPVCGVTIMEAVAVFANEKLLIAVNDGILPVPSAARPIDVLLFVQTKLVPATVPFNTISLVVAPLQKV